MDLGGEWKDRTVLVTGGSGGIGKATASLFKKAGADVFLCGKNEQALGAAAQQLCLEASRIIYADVSDVTDCESSICKLVRVTGRLDLLINAAGVWSEGAAEDTTEAEWDRVIDVNLKGTFFMCRYAIPFLAEVSGGIINISSDAGIMGNKGAAIYSASKGGVNLLTKALALELAPRGIRVNAVCPCDVDTPMIDHQARIFGGGDPEGYKRQLLSTYPQGKRARFAKAEEIAALVYFIASTDAAPITGACLPIDFGLSAGI